MKNTEKNRRRKGKNLRNYILEPNQGEREELTNVRKRQALRRAQYLANVMDSPDASVNVLEMGKEKPLATVKKDLPNKDVIDKGLNLGSYQVSRPQMREAEKRVREHKGVLDVTLSYHSGVGTLFAVVDKPEVHGDLAILVKKTLKAQALPPAAVVTRF